MDSFLIIILSLLFQSKWPINYQYQLHKGIFYKLHSYSTFCFYAHFRTQVFGYILTLTPDAQSALNAVIQEDVFVNVQQLQLPLFGAV